MRKMRECHKRGAWMVIAFLLPILAAAQGSVESGKALYEARKFKEARVFFEDVPEKSKEYGKARYFLGRIAVDQKEYDDAIDFFEEATEADPKQAEYFSRLGNVCA